MKLAVVIFLTVCSSGQLSVALRPKNYSGPIGNPNHQAWTARMETCREAYAQSRALLSDIPSKPSSSASSISTFMQKYVGNSLRDLVSVFRRKHLNLTSTSNWTDDDWSKLVADYEKLKNATMKQVLDQSRDISKLDNVLPHFEELEEASKPKNFIVKSDHDIREVARRLKTSESIIRVISNNMLATFDDFPLTLTPQPVWNSRWERIESSVRRDVPRQNVSEAIRALHKLKVEFNFNVLPKLCMRPCLIYEKPAKRACETALHLGLPTHDVEVIMDAITEYMFEDFFVPKARWVTARYLEYPPLRNVSFENARRLAKSLTVSDGRKVDEVFDEIVARARLAKLVLLREYLANFIGHALALRTGNFDLEMDLVHQMLKKLEPLLQLQRGYIGMVAHDVMGITSVLVKQYRHYQAEIVAELPIEQQGKADDLLTYLWRFLSYSQQHFEFLSLESQDFDPVTIRDGREYAEYCDIHEPSLKRILRDSQLHLTLTCFRRHISNSSCHTPGSSSFTEILHNNLNSVNEWIAAEESSIYAFPMINSVEISCFYRTRSLDFIEVHRGKFLLHIQSNGSSFLETLRRDAATVGKSEKFLENESKLVEKVISEWSGEKPPNFVENQILSLSDMYNVFNASLAFLRGFEETCISKIGQQGKPKLVFKALGDLWVKDGVALACDAWKCNESPVGEKVRAKIGKKLP